MDKARLVLPGLFHPGSTSHLDQSSAPTNLPPDKEPVWTAYVPNRAIYPPGRSIRTGRNIFLAIYVLTRGQDRGVIERCIGRTPPRRFRCRTPPRRSRRAQPVGFAPGPPPGSIAPWTPTYYGRIRSLRVALLLAFGRIRSLRLAQPLVARRSEL